MHKKLLGRTGPLGVFHDYPILLRLALISICAETAWATLIAVMEYHFKDDLLRNEAQHYIASRVAVAFLAFTMCEAVFKVPMGALSDRIGPRPIVITALFAGALSPFLMTFAQQWYYFVPLRALDGLAAAALWPSMSALMARAVPRDAKAAAMSVFNAAYCVGLAIGPMTGLYIGAKIGNQYVFPLCSILMLTGAIVAYYVLSSIPAGAAAATARQDSEGAYHVSEDLRARRSLLRGRPMLIRMMALYALSQTAVGMLATVLPLYLADKFNIQQEDLPRLIVLPALFIALVAVPLGRMADSIGRPRAIWISYAFAGAGMLLVAITNGMAVNQRHVAEMVFGVGMLLLVASYILGTPAWLGLTSLQVEHERQAEALSLMQTAQGVGVVIGLGVVASAGHLLTQVQRVNVKIYAHKPHVMILPEKWRTLDTVPISVWLYVATAVFVLCLIGTLLVVREPAHSLEAEEDAASAKQPLEITGV
ncbi:MAG: MFS transporter [Armatimonadota bacterium]|nr:MFS transporter [Armatimonadota bacterium]